MIYVYMIYVYIYRPPRGPGWPAVGPPLPPCPGPPAEGLGEGVARTALGYRRRRRRGARPGGRGEMVSSIFSNIDENEKEGTHNKSFSCVFKTNKIDSTVNTHILVVGFRHLG